MVHPGRDVIANLQIASTTQHCKWQLTIFCICHGYVSNANVDMANYFLTHFWSECVLMLGQKTCNQPMLLEQVNSTDLQGYLQSTQVCNSCLRMYTYFPKPLQSRQILTAHFRPKPYLAILDPVHAELASLEVTMNDVVTLWLAVELPRKVEFPGVEVWKVVIGLCATVDGLDSMSGGQSTRKNTLEHVANIVSLTE